MPHIFTIEAQLVDHPEYETLVDVCSSESSAIAIVNDKLVEVIQDYGESETIQVTKVSDTQIVMKVEDLAKYYITKRLVK